MSPLRVAVVAACPFPYPRGTPIRARRLSEAVAGLGHDVHVATYHVGEGPVDPGLRVWRITAPAWVSPVAPGPSVPKLALLDPLLLHRFRRTLARHGPFDVIHAHHYEGLLVALAARRLLRVAVPVVYDAHTLLETELPTYRGLKPRGLLRAVGRRLDRAVPPRADHVVAVSEGLRDRLRALAGIPEDRLTAVGNGLEPEAFAHPHATPSPPADGGTLVYAGNLAPYHRVDLLLEAFVRLVGLRPRARLRIFTEAPSGSLRDRARALGIAHRVELRAVGFPDLCRELARADLAVNPRPLCDGVPQKNLNYMAAGLPLVAFPGSLHPFRDGVTGVAVEAVDPVGLAAAIAGLLDRPAELARMGAEARRVAEAEFSWKASARRVEDIYRRLLTRRSDGIGAPAGS